jgi:phage shock protein PspC (stress-responsive transcriptional regulator)
MRRLYRSTKECKIAGVCGGIAEMLDWDPSQIRLLVVFIALCTGILPAMLTYLIAVIILPKEY